MSGHPKNPEELVEQLNEDMFSAPIELDTWTDHEMIRTHALATVFEMLTGKNIFEASKEEFAYALLKLSTKE